VAYKNLTSFGAGEITPELYERGNLEKFRTGLAKLRNAFVTKTGGLKSRSGTRHSFVPKTSGTPSEAATDEHRYFWIKSCNWLLEFGKFKFTIYKDFDYKTLTFGSILFSDVYANMNTVSNIDKTFVQFPDVTYDDKYIYIVGENFTNYVIDIAQSTLDNDCYIWSLYDKVQTYTVSSLYSNYGFTYNRTATGSFTNSYEIIYA